LVMHVCAAVIEDATVSSRGTSRGSGKGRAKL
jgi:hypothetical protein